MLLKKKKELLQRLQTFMRGEDAVISLHTQHIQNTVFFSGLEPNRVKELKETLNMLGEESTGHKEILEKLFKKVEESQKDVF